MAKQKCGKIKKFPTHKKPIKIKIEILKKEKQQLYHKYGGEIFKQEIKDLLISLYFFTCIRINPYC